MASNRMLGAGAGALGAIAGDVVRAQNIGSALSVGGFALAPTLAAGVGGLVAGMLGGRSAMLAGFATGAAGDAAARLGISLVPAIDFRVGPVSAGGAVVGAGAGALVMPLVA